MVLHQQEQEVGLPSIHFFSFSVLIQELGSSKATRPEPRTLHFNPDEHISTCHVRLLHKSNVTYAVRVEQIRSVIFDDTQPCSLILAFKQQLHGPTRWLLDFNNHEDNAVFRLAFDAVRLRQYTPQLFANHMLMEGTAGYKKGLSGFSTCYAVVVPSRIILLDNATSAFPRKVINLLCSNPSDIRWEPKQGLLYVTTRGRGGGGVQQPSLVTLKLGSNHPAWLAAIQLAIQIPPIQDKEDKEAATQQQHQYQSDMMLHQEVPSRTSVIQHPDTGHRQQHALPTSLVPAAHPSAASFTACGHPIRVADHMEWNGQGMQYAAGYQQSSLKHCRQLSGIGCTTSGMPDQDTEQPSVDELLRQASSTHPPYSVRPEPASIVLPFVNQELLPPQTIQSVTSGPISTHNSMPATGTQIRRRPTTGITGQQPYTMMMNNSCHKRNTQHTHSQHLSYQEHDSSGSRVHDQPHIYNDQHDGCQEPSSPGSILAAGSGQQQYPPKSMTTLSTHALQQHNTGHCLPPHMSQQQQPLQQHTMHNTTDLSTAQAVLNKVQSQLVTIQRSLTQQGLLLSSPTTLRTTTMAPCTAPHSHHNASHGMDNDACCQHTNDMPTRAPSLRCTGDNHIRSSSAVLLGNQNTHQHQRCGGLASSAAGGITSNYNEKPYITNNPGPAAGSVMQPHIPQSSCPFCSHTLPQQNEPCINSVEDALPASCQRMDTRHNTPHGGETCPSLPPSYVSVPTSSIPLQHAVGGLHSKQHGDLSYIDRSESMQGSAACPSSGDPVTAHHWGRNTEGRQPQPNPSSSNTTSSHLSLCDTRANSLAVHNHDVRRSQYPATLSDGEHIITQPYRVSTTNTRNTDTTCWHDTDRDDCQLDDNIHCDNCSTPLAYGDADASCFDNVQPCRQSTSIQTRHASQQHCSRHFTVQPMISTHVSYSHIRQPSEHLAAEDLTAQQIQNDDSAEVPCQHASHASMCNVSRHEDSFGIISNCSSPLHVVDELTHQHMPPILLTRKPLPPACQPLAQEISFAMQQHDDMSVDHQLRLQSQRNTAYDSWDVKGTERVHDVVGNLQHQPDMLHNPGPTSDSNTTCWPHTPRNSNHQLRPAFSHAARRVSHMAASALTRHGSSGSLPPDTSTYQMSDTDPDPDPELAAARHASALIVPAAKQACDNVTSAVSNILSVFGYDVINSDSCLQTPHQQLSSYNDSHCAGRLTTAYSRRQCSPKQSGHQKNNNNNNRHGQRPSSILAGREAMPQGLKSVILGTNNAVERTRVSSTQHLNSQMLHRAISSSTSPSQGCEMSSPVMQQHWVMPSHQQAQGSTTPPRRSVSAPRSRRPTAAVNHTTKSIHSLLKSLGSGALTPADVLNALH